MTDTDVSGREPTREEIIAFLNGEGMLEDCWFGEKHPSHSGYFWWRKYLNRLRSPGGDGEKRAPVQGYAGGIPWSMHLRAYDAYCKKYGPQKALIDLEGRNCRGGFHAGELDEFIPGWRDELSEITHLKAEVKRLTAALSAAEATSAPTPAPVSASEREELARAVENNAADLDSLSFDFDGDSSQMDAITEAADHLRNYATALRTRHGLLGEAIPQAHIITLRNHVDKLAEQYGNNVGIVVALRAILSRLSPASRED